MLSGVGGRGEGEGRRCTLALLSALPLLLLGQPGIERGPRKHKKGRRSRRGEAVTLALLSALPLLPLGQPSGEKNKEKAGRG